MEEEEENVPTTSMGEKPDESGKRRRHRGIAKVVCAKLGSSGTDKPERNEKFSGNNRFSSVNFPDPDAQNYSGPPRRNRKKSVENIFLHRLVVEDALDEPLRSSEGEFQEFPSSKRTSGDGIEERHEKIDEFEEKFEKIDEIEELEDDRGLGVAPVEPSTPSGVENLVKIEKMLKKLPAILDPESIPHGYHDYREYSLNKFDQDRLESVRKLSTLQKAQSSGDIPKGRSEDIPGREREDIPEGIDDLGSSKPASSNILPPIASKSTGRLVGASDLPIGTAGVPIGSSDLSVGSTGDSSQLKNAMLSASLPTLGMIPISVADRRQKM